MRRDERPAVALRVVREAATMISAYTRPLRVRLKASVANIGGCCGWCRPRVGGERLPERAVLSTGSPGDRLVNARNNLAEFAGLVLGERDVRRLGVAGQDMSHVSSGLLDAYRGRGDGPRPWAAGALPAREAGGVTTTRGGSCRQPGNDTMVASSSLLHNGVLPRLPAVRAAGGATVR